MTQLRAAGTNNSRSGGRSRAPGVAALAKAAQHGPLMIDFDESGWVTGVVRPLPVGEAWSLLSPDPSSRIDAGRWAQKGRTFFRCLVEVEPRKRYPAATLPLADAAWLTVEPLGEGDREAPSRVLVLTTPLDRAPAIATAAAEAARAIGGAGFDALVEKGQRLWQVRAAPEEGGDPRAPLAAAALLAAVFLAPVLPPGGGAIFGVKGARERLERLGWRT